jgi:hypothetical protein
VTSDFTDETLHLPPGVGVPPRFSTEIPEPAWRSPVVSHRLTNVGTTGGHLVVGGRTIWVNSGPIPAAIVASQPNRLGSGENLVALVDLAAQLGAEAHVEVDPWLGGTVDLPSRVRPIVLWPEAGSPRVLAAAARAQQAAGALRRRLAQVKGLTFPIEHPFGRTVTVVLPLPGITVVEFLASAGTALSTVEFWEGGLSITLGWWHTRLQIDALAAAIAAIVSGSTPLPVPPDRFDRIPDDLPLRRLDTIPFS